jgi:hypothetical protein
VSHDGSVHRFCERNDHASALFVGAGFSLGRLTELGLSHHPSDRFSVGCGDSMVATESRLIEYPVLGSVAERSATIADR